MAKLHAGYRYDHTWPRRCCISDRQSDGQWHTSCGRVSQIYRRQLLSCTSSVSELVEHWKRYTGSLHTSRAFAIMRIKNRQADGDLHLDNVAHAYWLMGNKNREQNHTKRISYVVRFLKETDYLILCIGLCAAKLHTLQTRQNFSHLTAKSRSMYIGIGLYDKWGQNFRKVVEFETL